MPKPKRAIALILSLFVLIVLGGFVSLAAYQYVSDRIIHQHYENSIRGLYAIEAARNILNWEESQATPPNTWTTLTGVSGTAPTSGTAAFSEATITDGFYKLTGYNGYNIKAKVLITSGNVCMYIQAYKGEEANPQDAQYLEYIHSPSPMYKYAMFKNTSLTFSGSKLYDLKGGSLHTNGDLILQPSGSQGLLFNNVGEISAHGTIKYDKRAGWHYPQPSAYDILGDGKLDGMAPAPPLQAESANSTYYSYSAGDHYRTTTGEAVMPGPFRSWANDSSGNIYLAAGYPYPGGGTYDGSGRGDTIAANAWWAQDGTGSNPYPFPFSGEESYFYGRQTKYGSYYNNGWANEQTADKYVNADGLISDTSFTGSSVTSFFMDGGLLVYETSNGGLYKPTDVYFKPATTKSGVDNDAWFSLPGSLPQEYDYANTGEKYTWAGSTPISFYATEACQDGSSGCVLDPRQKIIDSTNTIGWRYLKQDKDGNPCTNSCYDDPSNTTIYSKGVRGGYVNAKDYVASTTPDDASYDACVSKRTTDCATEKTTCINSCVISKAYENCGYYNGSCDYYCQTGYGTYGYSDISSCTSGCMGCVETWTNYCQNSVCQTCSIPECLKSDYTSKIYYYDKMFQGASKNLNNDFLKNYIYGSDIVSGSRTHWNVTALNTQQQSTGFNKYLTDLSKSNIEGVLESGADIKEPFLKSLFDEPTVAGKETSPYKTKASAAGLYVPAVEGGEGVLTRMQAVAVNLNKDTGGNPLPEGQEFATATSFYNWKTAQTVTLIDIDVAKLKAAVNNGKVSFSNGIIYSEVPIRLSEAEDLPGSNAGDKKAVFTVVSEESVYLRGDYNTTDWKISNIATPKKVYTLSNDFDDPAYVDTTLYPNYPYVKVKIDEKIDGVITKYGDIDTSDGPATSDQVWVNALDAKNSNTSYPTMPSTKREEIYQAVFNSSTGKQPVYASTHTQVPNPVDKSSYSYNSLFVTPYDFDVLENWKPGGNTATRNITGAFIDFSGYTSPDPYKTALGLEGGFNYTARNRYAPCSPYGYLFDSGYNGVGLPNTVQSYDDKFPTASPTSSEGVLGFTGQDSWRFISKEYFDIKT